MITEGTAIMTHVADSVPDRVLLPAPGTLDRAKAMEWMAFLASAVHPAFRTMFRAERVAGDSEQAIKNVREHGITALAEALEEAEHRASPSRFLVSDAFTLCDSYLTVFFLWSLRVPLKEKLPPIPRCAAVARQVLSRPTVKAVLAVEGIEP